MQRFHLSLRAGAAALAFAGCLGNAVGQQDRNAERAARRLQLQMQSLQQQLQDAQAAKAKADADNAALTARLKDGEARIAAAEDGSRKLEKRLADAQAERSQFSTTVAELQKKLADQQRGADEAKTTQDQALAAAQRERDDERRRDASRSAEATKTIADCTTKNERLVALGADLLGRYRRKGAIDALKQEEPFLGLGDVDMFNVVQDYRDKLDAERYAPPAAGPR